MKTLVSQTVVSDSKRFENNVLNTLPEGVETFTITSFSMQRSSGYGSYNYVMDVEINDEYVTLKKFTHDSIDFDYYTDLDYMSHNFNNWVKRRVLSMLENDAINDQIFEIANKEDEEE